MTQKTIGFISEIDQFLKAHDKHAELSASQRKEKEKFKRIFCFRDVADRQNETKSLNGKRIFDFLESNENE